ncbi:DNA-(apurinic or apyrimidinic site) lyase [Armadillidium vulgare]|nr:DNA-(apurinic or apyrimidinic site) lyase [Armadillidium vulgare]
MRNFILLQHMIPNAGRGLVTLDKRMDWDSLLQDYLKKLDEKKPVIYCGDLNVSHQEIDLANPKSNKRNAGFTKEEREGFTNLLNEGFVDSFRELYPDKKGQYTFWSYMGNARAKNVGWRLDYFVLSERLRPNLRDNIIHNSVMGSDHCPISLLIEIEEP